MLVDEPNPRPTVLFAAGEAFPFAKTGGLGDVVGALPKALAERGARPVVFLPAYREIRRCGLPIVDVGVEFTVPIGGKQVAGGLLRGKLPDSNIDVYFVRQDDYYDRPGIYGEKNVAYADNCERYVFLCRAVMESIRLLGLEIDVLHAHDWHAGLLPALHKIEYRDRPSYERITNVFTVHNLQYQGEFWHWDMLLTGLDWRYFNWRQMEAFGKLNLLKTGLAFADAISTVSHTYALEFQTPDFGYGLDGMLRYRSDVLGGIVNGIDDTIWNPTTDVLLPKNYSSATVAEGKAASKEAVQKQTGLVRDAAAPLAAFIGRLVEQKGVDLILEVLDEWIVDSDMQWAFLAGDGEPALLQKVERAAAAHPDRVAVVKGYSEPMAHLLTAGADILLMPSRFEPCGLNQLYALKYGTVPVVHAVGGLADTVVNTSAATLADGTATGFTFGDGGAHRLGESLALACELYRGRPEVWAALRRNGMEQDWSWSRSADEYLELYRQAFYLAHRQATVDA